jgi:glycosyltransferase involved in cell wall biosynthesis
MSRPRRFCMITTFYPPYNFGGDGVFVHRLANELARRGHRVDVVHCVDSYRLLARGDPARGYDDHPNVTVHGLRSPLGPVSPLVTQQTGRPLLNAARLRRILEAPFDVVHYHNVSLVGGPGILAWGQGVKLYTTHEYWLICPTHVLFKYNRAACTRPHCFACSLSYRRPPQWWRYTRLLQSAVRHVDIFLAPSRFCQAIHHQRGLDLPFVHLPNFLPEPDPPPAVAESPAVPDDKPYFLFVGRLEKLKGLQTLIPHFRDYPPARLCIAGTGSYESRLRHLAAGSPNVRFLGFVSGVPLQDLYRHARAVIAPSLCYDVFPNVLLEAFRERTPVVVRNRGGMPEFVHDSGGGFVYDEQEELVAALDRLSADPSLRNRLGRAAYQAYQQNWTADAHLARYLDLVDRIAGQKAGLEERK